MIKQFTWINGQFFPENQTVFTVNNRSFAYGDGLFETIHAYGTTARHLNLHFERITKGMKLIELDIPPFLSPTFLDKEITRTLNKNRIFGSARVRLTIFRDEGGFYTPHNHNPQIVIQTQSLPHDFYELNKKGLVVDIYTQFRKPINDLASIKTCNSLIYVMAGLHKNRLGVDDCLLINDQNRVAESISSNLFFAMGNNLYTPSLEEGCVEGILRKLIISIAPGLGIKVVDKASVEPHELLHADELFLTNAVKGIQWVVGFKERRYFCKISRLLTSKLNSLTFPDQFKDGFSG